MDKPQYAILRFAKYKGPEIGRIEAHDERTKEKYASNPDNSLKGNDGNEYLRAFDFLADTFNRCERNFALSTKWDELTSPVVESF